MKDFKKPGILFMGTFPPRECGIATFTQDLTTALDKKFSLILKSGILAMNRNGINIYNYPKDVLFQINDDDIQSYTDVAKMVNCADNIRLVNIQHEFGIFGGEYGSYLVAFLEALRKPVIITFHSVLKNPNRVLRKVVETLARKSACIIVMIQAAVEILHREYQIETDIRVIPHGIPNMPFKPSIEEKEKIGYGDRIILLSFGMINPGKGYEYVIDALPRVAEKFPNVLYLIIGETHPIVRKEKGEQYRNFLENKVKNLGLENNVKFYNKYVKREEIIQYLLATDLFICSNIDPGQVSSGTLSYAVGAGRVVVSTPFLHATELVTPERGELAEFGNPESFKRAILRILSDPKLKEKMEIDAYANTREMTWDNVALTYNSLFNEYIDLYRGYWIKIPKINLNHFMTLTDNFGMIQFAEYTQPDLSSGYSIDDNARAMLVCCMHYNTLGQNLKAADLLEKYLNIIKYVQQSDGKFYNYIDEHRKVDLERWSADTQGRVLWALGYLMNSQGIPAQIKEEAERLLLKGLNIIDRIESPRAIAFLIIGLYFFNQAKPLTLNVEKIRKLADYIVNCYRENSSREWPWFEKTITYSNSKLPEALFCAYLATKDKNYLEIARTTLDFLKVITFENGLFSPIGQDGWYTKNGRKAYFDQQPEEVASMVQTLILAYKITQQDLYLKDGITAFQWFLGRNCLNRMVYDEVTGGCHDGLGESSVNLNEGAESTLSYLLARISVEEFIKKSKPAQLTVS